MFDKLEKVKERYNEIAELLNKPETMNDQRGVPEALERVFRPYGNRGAHTMNTLRIKQSLDENKKAFA